MKIAYVLAEYPSRSETFVAREIAALRERGFEIEIWALRAGDGARKISFSNQVRLMMKLRGASQTHWEDIGREWARREHSALQDVAHIHAGWASFPAAIARGAAGVLRKPWSFSGHARDLWVEGVNLSVALQAAKFAAVCTREGAQFLKNQAPHNAHKILYAPHGIDLSQFSFTAARKLHSPVRLLSVGRFVEKKGIENLLPALALLQNSPRYQFHLTLIGDGPLRRKLHKKVQLLRLQEGVTFMGALPLSGVLRTMQTSDLLIQSSVRAQDGDRDGLPNVLLEAAACGLPIVGTRAGAIEDFLDESCAWLWSRGDLPDAELITRAIELYPQSLAKAQAARRRVEDKFDIKKNIAVLAHAFETDALRA
jgi:glycosyltransferase involved in cell wall biosynthesis